MKYMTQHNMSLCARVATERPSVSNHNLHALCVFSLWKDCNIVNVSSYICSNDYYTTLVLLRGGYQLEVSRIDDDPNTKVAETHLSTIRVEDTACPPEMGIHSWHTQPRSRITCTRQS